MSADLYITHRPMMGTFDRLEWRSDTVFGSIVRWKTGSNSNHTGMVMRFPSTATGLSYPVFTAEAGPHGPDLNRLSVRMNDFMGKVWWHRLHPRYHSLRPQLMYHALKYEGLPYDLTSLLRQLFYRVRPDKKEIFCSEYVFLVGADAGLPVPEDYPYAPRPGKDLQDLGWWESGVRIK